MSIGIDWLDSWGQPTELGAVAITLGFFVVIAGICALLVYWERFPWSAVKRGSKRRARHIALIMNDQARRNELREGIPYLDSEGVLQTPEIKSEAVTAQPGRVETPQEDDVVTLPPGSPLKVVDDLTDHECDDPTCVLIQRHGQPDRHIHRFKNVVSVIPDASESLEEEIDDLTTRLNIALDQYAELTGWYEDLLKSYNALKVKYDDCCRNRNRYYLPGGPV